MKYHASFPSLFEDSTPFLPTRESNGQDALPGVAKCLADWITRHDNRLTARVMVNRIWQYHFGRGIVRSSNNFGRLGTPPTHPELLDYPGQSFH